MEPPSGGEWRDPLAGRDLLWGVLLGVSGR